MAENSKNVEKTKRQLLNERMQQRYPDINVDDDDQMFERINSDYDDYDNQIAGYKEREGKFSDMFTSDPRSARLMMGWKNGEDVAVNLVRLYGTDIADAINDPEKQEAIAEANKEYMERVAKEKGYEDEYNNNLQESLDTLNKMKEEDGVSDDDIDAAMELILTISKDAMLGKFTPETIKLALNAKNYDADLALAAQEAETRGRNTKIKEQLRKPDKGDGTAHLDGQNGNGGRKAPPANLGALDNYGDGNQTIFERGGEKRIPIRR